MDISSEPTSSDSFKPTKRSISSKTRKVRISWFKKSFSRRSKETQISEKRFRFAKACWNSLCLKSKTLTKKAQFFYLTSTFSTAASNSALTRFLTVSIRFITRILKKTIKNTIIIYTQVQK